MSLPVVQGWLCYYSKHQMFDGCTFELLNLCNMIRQIIIPTSNTYTLELPDELLGRKVEVLAFEVDNELVITLPDNEAVKFSKASDIFKDCRVDLTNYKFDRDAANTYE